MFLVSSPGITGHRWLTGNIAVTRWPFIFTLICIWYPNPLRLPLFISLDLKNERGWVVDLGSCWETRVWSVWRLTSVWHLLLLSSCSSNPPYRPSRLPSPLTQTWVQMFVFTRLGCTLFAFPGFKRGWTSHELNKHDAWALFGPSSAPLWLCSI